MSEGSELRRPDRGVLSPVGYSERRDSRWGPVNSERQLLSKVSRETIHPTHAAYLFHVERVSCQVLLVVPREM